MAGSKETSRIEVFFGALGSERLQNAFLKNAAAAKTMQSATQKAGRLGSSGLTDLTRGYGRLESAALRTASVIGNVGSSGYNAFRNVVGSIADATRTMLRFGAVASAVAAGGLALIGKAIQNITEGGQDLQATVLGLRALNNEIDKGGNLPTFSYGKKGAISSGTGSIGPEVVLPDFGQITNQIDKALAGAGSALGGGNSLNFLSGGFIDSASIGKTASDLDFLTGAADKFGASIGPLAKSYTQFKAAAKSANLTLSEQRDVILGVQSASVALGISQDDSNGILRALNQVASKGCHAAGTLIRMADGTMSLVEEIEVGDELMGPDGMPRQVLRLAHGRQTMYRVIPSEGMPFEVNADHKLRVAENGEHRTVVMSDLAIDFYDDGWTEWQLIRRLGDEVRLVEFQFERIEEGEYFGFEITGDHLYLDAQGFEHHNTLQAEELRGQIGDRLPGAFGLAARAMGVTEVELNALMKEGLVPASTFLRSFATQLKKEYGPAAESALGTTRVAAGRVSNAFIQAKANIFSGKESLDSFNAAAAKGQRTGLTFGVTLDKAVGRLLNSVTSLFRRLGEGGVFESFGGGLAGIVERIAQVVDRSDGFVKKLLAGVISFGNGAITLLGYVGRAFLVLKSILTDDYYSNNPLIAFFQSLRAVAVTFFQMVASGFTGRPKALDIVQGALVTLTETFTKVAQTFASVAAGRPFDGPFLGLAIQLAKVRGLIDALSGEGTSFIGRLVASLNAEAAAGFPTFERYANALEDLFSGRQLTDPQGTLGIFFKLRDTITNEVVPAIVILSGIIVGLYNAAITLKPIFDALVSTFFNIVGAIGDVISYIPGLGGIGETISSLKGVDTFLQAFLIARFVSFIGLVPLVVGAFNLIRAAAIFTNVKFQTLKAVSNTLFAGIGPKAALATGQALGGIRRLFVSAITKLVPLIVTAGSALLTGLTTAVTTAISLLSSAIAFIFSPAGLIILAIAALVAVIYFYWDDIVAGAKSAFEWFTTTLPDLIGDGFQAAWDTVKGTAETLWQALKKGFGFLIDSILAPFHLIYDIVRKIVKATGSDLLDDITFPTFSAGGEAISNFTGEGRAVRRDDRTGEIITDREYGLSTADIARADANRSFVMSSERAARAQAAGLSTAKAGPRANGDFSQARNIVINGNSTPVLMTKAGETDLEAQARQLAARQSGPMPQWAGQNRTG